ncbi:C-type lectin domain family 10 member A-like [Asterias amurensis]|uniref:C-type lectin domain family 10 member A-like n=1 Tax=Asterias amurensis TaxID=7602 RepID=UPI003AB1FDAC
MHVNQVFGLVLGVYCGHLLAEACPPDWHRYGESCYYIIKDKMDWYQARSTCAESRASLAIPNSKSEQEYIWELFLKGFDQTPDASLWIGCNDIEKEGNWKHCPLKGETKAYENWQDGEPNDYESGEDCGKMGSYFHGKWNDNTCNEENYAVCEITFSKTPKFCLQTGKDGRLVSPEHSLPRH